MSDFLIIGAGAIGLLQARELALAGAKVTIIDRGLCGQEASWAGGGIVSPLYPWRYSAPVTALSRWAQDLYPELAASLLDETGIDAELVRTGLLMLEPGDETAAVAWARESGRPVEQVGPDFIYEREPLLARGFERGLWMADIANIRNPRMVKALVKMLRQLPNVTIHEQCELTGFRRSGNHVLAAEVLKQGNRAEIAADIFVVCTGAWTGRVLAASDCAVPVQPVKGQMLLYYSDRPLIKSIVLYAGRYLIPRSDGHVLAGSTLEHAQFDKSITVEARESLQASAAGILPSLRAVEPVRQWSGLRPGAPDGIPFIGQVPVYDNLYVNAGQYRNGLVLAPASARLLADILLGRALVVDPGPYALKQIAARAGSLL